MRSEACRIQGLASHSAITALLVDSVLQSVQIVFLLSVILVKRCHCRGQRTSASEAYVADAAGILLRLD